MIENQGITRKGFLLGGVATATGLFAVEPSAERVGGGVGAPARTGRMAIRDP